MKVFEDSFFNILMDNNSVIHDEQVREEIKTQLRMEYDDLNEEIIMYFSKKIVNTSSIIKKSLLKKTLNDYIEKYKEDEKAKKELIDKLSISLAEIVVNCRHYYK